MVEAPLPENEAKRLEALHAYEVLDTEPETAFDDATRVAAALFQVPICLISLVDESRQWFKSRVGLDACETPRGVAFCSHAILNPERALVVPDASSDTRFSNNPLVVGPPHIRFYAGAPLVTPNGEALGTLCIIDRRPRTIEKPQIELLEGLSRQVVSQLELRRTCWKLSTTVDRLQRANRELRDFTHIAAHDLQEPLRKLVAFSDLLEQDLGGDLPRRAAEDLDYLRDSAERMQTLISDLLELSRAGTSDLRLTDVSLRVCVEEALEAMSLTVEESNADVRVGELPIVRADERLMTQLFQNLVSNALKFVPDDRRPEIEISATEHLDATIIGVKDNGIGVDPKHAEKIFSPFQRLHGRTAYAGTGIGLAIARKAAERHCGRIWVESTSGSGSHFRLSLPKSSDRTGRLSETSCGSETLDGLGKAS